MSRSDAPALVPVAESASAPGPHLALVPGEAAPILRLDLPPGLRGLARERVARRQAADRLSLAPDAVDVRLLPEAAGAALVVDPAEAAAWRRAVGASCAALVPDYLALAAAPGVWVLHAAGGRLLARLGKADGFAAELPLARLQLARALVEAPPAAALRTGEAAPEIDALLAEAGVPVFTEPAALEAAGHPRPAPPQWERTAADLLQSPETAAAQLRARIRLWGLPAAVAALALALWIADTGIRIDRARDTAAALEAAATEVVRARFVPSGPLLDIRAQVSRRAAELAAGADDADPSPLTVLRRAAPALQAPGIRLTSVAWRTGGGLETAVAADDFAAVEALARRLREADLGAEVVDALADGNGGVLARLRLDGAS